MFYCVFVHFFATFCCALDFAARRWLRSEPDALVNDCFHSTLLVRNFTQVAWKGSYRSSPKLVDCFAGAL
jgi:hypothetical protein